MITGCMHICIAPVSEKISHGITSTFENKQQVFRRVTIRIPVEKVIMIEMSRRKGIQSVDNRLQVIFILDRAD